MSGQRFSMNTIKKCFARLLLFPFILLLPVLASAADPAAITISGNFQEGFYIGKDLEIVSEEVVFSNLSRFRTLPPEVRNILLSGKMSSDPEINVILTHTENGYRVEMEKIETGRKIIIEWGVEDASAPEISASYRKSEEKLPVLDFSGNAYWIKFALNNPGLKPVNLMIQLEKSIYSWFDLFYPHGGGYRMIAGAYEFPMNRRAVQDSRIVFPLRLEPGLNSFYIRTDSQLVDTVPIRLWTERGYYRHSMRNKFIYGGIFGATFILLMYALFLAVSVREKGYFYLAMLIAAGYMVHIASSGLGFELIWQQHPMFSIALFSLAYPLTVIGNLLFCRYYLDTKTHTPGIDRILSAMIYIAVLLAAVQFFIPISGRCVFTTFSMVLDYLTVLPMICATIVSLIRKKSPENRKAIFMLTAVSFQLLSYIEFWMSYSNLLPLGLIDFIHVRSLGFVLVMLLGLRYKLRELEQSITGIRSELNALISKRESERREKAVTDNTQIKVEAVRDLIEARYRDPLSRYDLAASVNMSQDHLGRMFKLLTGEKISDYINRLRVDEACRMLTETDRKIIDIAFDVGFENLRTFNLCFVRVTGASPSVYRGSPEK
jgi:AraC-like DNA-binding protein